MVNFGLDCSGHSVLLYYLYLPLDLMHSRSSMAFQSYGKTFTLALTVFLRFFPFRIRYSFH